jgi:hypothetical protein
LVLVREQERRTGRGTTGNVLIIVTFAKVPETDLVEIVQSQIPHDGVDEVGVFYGDGDKLGDVELEEVGLPNDGAVAYVADEN